MENAAALFAARLVSHDNYTNCGPLGGDGSLQCLPYHLSMVRSGLTMRMTGNGE